MCVIASSTALLLDWAAPAELGWESASNGNKEAVCCRSGQLKGRVIKTDAVSRSAALCKLPLLCRQTWLSSAGSVLVLTTEHRLRFPRGAGHCCLLCPCRSVQVLRDHWAHASEQGGPDKQSSSRPWLGQWCWVCFHRKLPGSGQGGLLLILCPIGGGLE